MSTVSKLLLLLLCLEHLYILYLEMFCWTHPKTVRALGLTEESAKQSKVLAANQGLYNGFLSAGLAWSLLEPSGFSKSIALFFVVCIFIAGLYGGLSAHKSILYKQALPALAALISLLLTGP